jgi:hypothetical protein
MLNFKNKTEREAFVNGYKNWTNNKGKKLGVWKQIPELDLRFYRYEFANGAVIIVTEFIEYRTIYGNDYYTPLEKEFAERSKFCLILPENDSYAAHYRTYTLNGCNLWTIVDYMTKNKLNL